MAVNILKLGMALEYIDSPTFIPIGIKDYAIGRVYFKI